MVVVLSRLRLFAVVNVTCFLLILIYLFMTRFNRRKWLEIGRNTSSLKDCRTSSTFETILHTTTDQDRFEYVEMMRSRVKFIRSQCDFVEASVGNIPSLFIADNLKLVHCGFYNTKAERLFTRTGFGRAVLHDFATYWKTTNHCTSLDFIKALYVQHPLEKLFDLYNDKALLDYYFGLPSSSPTFQTMHNNVAVLFPTFQSFLKHILNSTVHGFSLGSITELCHVCNIDYDVIIFPESRIRDLEYLFFHVLDSNRTDQVFEAMHKLQLKSIKHVFSDPSVKDSLYRIKSVYSSDLKLFNLTEFVFT